jgi:hypothetical protein
VHPNPVCLKWDRKLTTFAVYCPSKKTFSFEGDGQAEGIGADLEGELDMEFMDGVSNIKEGRL